MKKKWCDVCKFMTYGDCHPAIKIPVPPDVVLEKRFGLTLLSFTGDVPGMSTYNLEAHPQVAGRPLHLGVDPTVAPSFRIIDLRIGRNSQFAAYNSHGVAASCFQPQPEKGSPRNNLFGLEVFTPGHIIFLTVTNISPAMLHFNALMHVQTIRETPPQGIILDDLERPNIISMLTDDDIREMVLRR